MSDVILIGAPSPDIYDRYQAVCHEANAARLELHRLSSLLAASDLDRIRLRDGLKTAIETLKEHNREYGLTSHDKIADLEKLLGGEL